MDEEFFEIVSEHWGQILNLYKKIEDKKPIMLIDIQEQKLYAYPYLDYKSSSLCEMIVIAVPCTSIVDFLSFNITAIPSFDDQKSNPIFSKCLFTFISSSSTCAFITGIGKS